MEKIKANIILEIMGRPPEHIKETLNTLVVKLGSEKEVNVLNKKYHDPELVKDTKDLFIAFADVEIEFETLPMFFSVILAYMPSNVEVYEPEKFKMNTNEINELSNFFIGKLHKYDEIAKTLVNERDILARQLDFLKRETGGDITIRTGMGEGKEKQNTTSSENKSAEE